MRRRKQQRARLHDAYKRTCERRAQNKHDKCLTRASARQQEAVEQRRVEEEHKVAEEEHSIVVEAHSTQLGEVADTPLAVWAALYKCACIHVHDDARDGRDGRDAVSKG